MAEEIKQKSRLWLWIGAAILLVIVFFVARQLTRDRMPIHAAAATRTELVGTVSTNGIVEPVTNYEFHSPLATTVKELLVRQGDRVKSGTLLMQLDDMNARARVASAESALRSAEASNEAVRQGGTLEERQSLSSTVNRDQLDVAQRQRTTERAQDVCVQAPDDHVFIGGRGRLFGRNPDAQDLAERFVHCWRPCSGSPTGPVRCTTG